MYSRESRLPADAEHKEGRGMQDPLTLVLRCPLDANSVHDMAQKSERKSAIVRAGCHEQLR
jgi:hypothetical protein